MTDRTAGRTAGRVAALVPAAGRGERLGPGGPKALRSLAGEALLVHAVRALGAATLVDLVIVAAPLDGLAEVRGLPGLPSAVIVVAGGASRRESVAAALAAVPPDVDVVLVHDAARALAPSALADQVVLAVRAGHDAVVPGLPLADTVRQVDLAGRAVATPDRSALRAVQTPQGFRRAVLDAAHAAYAESASHRVGADRAATVTDDAGMVEQLGHPVEVIPGHEEAFKVTRPLDLLLAEAVLARRSRP